jgi:putative hemolysin
MEIPIIIFLILLNGIFSMSEIALVSSRKFNLESAAKKGNANARKALELANNPNTFLSTVQIGITLIGILTGIFSGEKMTSVIQDRVASVALLHNYSHTIAVIIVVIIITYFSIVFGELIPKRLGLSFPESIASFVAKPMSLLSTLTKPFIWLLTITNNGVLRLFGFKDKVETNATEDEIKLIIQDSAESGEIRQIEHGIVQRVFSLGDRKVAELMTHRSGLIWLDIHDSLELVKKKMAAEVHSIYPIADGELDNLVGIINVKDMFPQDLKNESFKLQDFVREAIVVHEHTPVYSLIEQFKHNRLHSAVIVDEYGAIQGMITMDDVIDALIGDASEYNQLDYQIIKRDDNSWLADGQFPFFEFLNYFNLSEGDNHPENFNTLAGLLLARMHHIPVPGEKLKWKDFEFEVIDMDDRRIDKILINRDHVRAV